MTDDRGVGHSHVGGRSERGFGTRPLLAVGVLGAGLLVLLAVGGIGAANAMSATPTVAASAPPTASPGAQAPVADPSTPPDRDSDQPVASDPEDTVYAIQDGDTLTSISAKLGVSVDAIAAYNAVRNVNVISEGSVLRVPFIYVPPTAAPAGEPSQG